MIWQIAMSTKAVTVFYDLKKFLSKDIFFLVGCSNYKNPFAEAGIKERTAYFYRAWK
jgi:hypothetical protein